MVNSDAENDVSYWNLRSKEMFEILTLIKIYNYSPRRLSLYCSPDIGQKTIIKWLILAVIDFLIYTGPLDIANPTNAMFNYQVALDMLDNFNL